MATYIITQCTISDGPALTADNIPAFWRDLHWILAWRHRTLEHHVAEVTKRFPRNLINNRETWRHQKAVDPETGEIVGYARWILPSTHATTADGALAWPEAVIPAVGPDEEAEIRRIASTAIWDPNTDSDELLVPIREIEEEILARKPYMRTRKPLTQLEPVVYGTYSVSGFGVYNRLGFKVEKETI
ncbi:acetyltransferase [Xylogone sp. PMI_703]|nr:acetyltransferase [Xylogone sp. PMI_703]